MTTPRQRHVVVMVTTSYPRFAGDGVGSFMEPIAKGIAARGHDVHLVAPWHPSLTRSAHEDGVTFHFFKYAPTDSLNIFGYATSLRADTDLKVAVWAVAPVAMLAGWRVAARVARDTNATVMHGHWVIPGGVIAALGAGKRPLVVSLHGSDVFVAERHGWARRAARRVFDRASWVTAPSDDLRIRAEHIGADPARSETVPYGVDVTRFAPSASTRADERRALGIADSAPLVFAAGRLVSKKGFEFLIDASRTLAAAFPSMRVVIAGDGDLRDALKERSAALPQVMWLGRQPQDRIGRLAAAADVVAVPSIRDEAGNVDGLPNFALEALATATPVVGSTAGGLPQAIVDGVTGRLVPERDAAALATAIGELLSQPDRASAMGAAARERVSRDFGWARVAERFEAAYDRAAQ